MEPKIETLAEVSEKLAKRALHRIHAPLNIQKEARAFKARILEGETFTRGVKKADSIEKLYYSNDSRSARMMANPELDLEDATQEVARVLIESGWKEGDFLDYEKHICPSFQAIRSVLRIDRKKEVERSWETDSIAEFNIGLEFARVFKSSARKPSRAKVRELRARLKAVKFEGRKAKHNKAQANGTLLSLIKYARGAGLADCPAFLDSKGQVKSQGAIRFQLFEFRALLGIGESE
jgi:hypothetical protein